MGVDERTVVDEDGREVFNLEKAQKGIHAVCDAMDALDLTLSERFHVLRCLMAPYSAMMGEKIGDLATLWGLEGDENGSERPENEEKPAE